MKTVFTNEVFKLKNKPHVDKKTVNAFLGRIESDKGLTKEQNKFEHFCSFFLPFDTESQSVYLGHHIKADDWIPPGGHIKLEETPVQTVYREFAEELGHKLTNEPIELFDLSIKDVSGNPQHQCRRHYDFWYVVHILKIDFQFDRVEFYDAGWFTLPEAKKKTKLKLYNNNIQKLKLL